MAGEDLIRPHLCLSVSCARLGQCLNISDTQLFHTPHKTENSLLIGLWCGPDGVRMLYKVKGSNWHLKTTLKAN